MKRRAFGKERVLKRDEGRCQYCGTETTEVDHIIPYSISPNNDLLNLVVCCGRCNVLAGSKLFKDFIEKKNFILDRRLKLDFPIPDPSLFPEFYPYFKKCENEGCVVSIDTRKNQKRFCSPKCRKENWTRTVKKEEPHGRFECLNCGRVLPRGRPNQRFCRTSCKDRYWSRGTRRVSKINIRLNSLIKTVGVVIETSNLLLGRIETTTSLIEEVIGIVKSNQFRIIKLEKELGETKNLQLLLHQGDM